MDRGKLTNEVLKVSKEQLGYEITVKQLRLLPYIQYLIMNGEPLDPRKLNAEEMSILEYWVDEGVLKNSTGIPHVNKKFYRAMCEILLVGYCLDYVED